MDQMIKLLGMLGEEGKVSSKPNDENNAVNDQTSEDSVGSHSLSKFNKDVDETVCLTTLDNTGSYGEEGKVSSKPNDENNTVKDQTSEDSVGSHSLSKFNKDVEETVCLTTLDNTGSYSIDKTNQESRDKAYLSTLRVDSCSNEECNYSHTKAEVPKLTVLYRLKTREGNEYADKLSKEEEESMPELEPLTREGGVTFKECFSKPFHFQSSMGQEVGD